MYLCVRLSIISTPHVDKMVQERKERRQRELGELELRLDTITDVREPPLTSAVITALVPASTAALAVSEVVQLIPCFLNMCNKSFSYNFH